MAASSKGAGSYEQTETYIAQALLARETTAAAFFLPHSELAIAYDIEKHTEDSMVFEKWFNSSISKIRQHLLPRAPREQVGPNAMCADAETNKLPVARRQAR